MAMERSTNFRYEVTEGRSSVRGKKNALNEKDGEQLTGIGGLTARPQLTKLWLSEAHSGLKEFQASVGLG